MHVGSFVAILVYFHLCGQGGFTRSAVGAALPVSLLVMSAYIALAYMADELKHFDFGLWGMLLIGTIGAVAGIDSLLTLFQWYSPALLFATLGLVALIPLLLGWEPFTYYFARRQAPPWQQKIPEFPVINRVMTLFWAGIFFISAGLASYAPLDWRFNTLYPNLLIFLIGVPAGFWIPPLYFKIFPPGRPQSIEVLLMGMPWAFNRRAAGDAKALIQFHMSGAEAGNYYLRIARGKCASFAGVAPKPDLTIHAPGTAWLRIVYKELDSVQAFQSGLCRAEGDLSLLPKFQAWFSS